MIDNRFLRPMGGNQAFSPLSLSPAIWLKDDVGKFQERTGASATTPAVADADPVGTWKDQSGNARHRTASSDAVRPTLKLAIQNGRSVVRFDGVDDFLKGAGFTLTQPTHVMFAGSLVANTNQARWFDGNTADSMIGYQAVGAGSLGLYAGGSGPSIAVATGWGIWSCKFNGATSLLRKNDLAPVTSGNVGAGNAGGLTLGAAASGANPSSIDFGEVLVFPTALSTGNETLVRDYLNSRWATF